MKDLILRSRRKTNYRQKSQPSSRPIDDALSWPSDEPGFVEDDLTQSIQGSPVAGPACLPKNDLRPLSLTRLELAKDGSWVGVTVNDKSANTNRWRVIALAALVALAIVALWAWQGSAVLGALTQPRREQQRSRATALRRR